MSYVRFGEDGSDVYVYEDVRGGLMCCGCALGIFPPGSAPMLDVDRFAAHLREHLDAGHVVPEQVIPAVLARADLPPRCVHGRYPMDACLGCGRRYEDGRLVGPFLTASS